MRIAVTTPTGHVGRHVVTGLVRAGVRPLVLARDPGRLDPELLPFVDTAVVDQFDADRIAAATAGIDVLHWVDPTAPGAPGGHGRATASVERAVRKNGIGRVVFQSSVGAELRHGAGDLDGLAATEVALDAIAADVTHLRCGYFHTNLLLQLDAVRAGLLRVVVPLDQPMAWVDPRDIAAVTVGRLLSPEWSGRVVQAVHGPQDLTWPQAATIVAEATGRPLRVERVTDDAMFDTLRGAGLDDDQIGDVMGMSTGTRDGFAPEQPRTPQTTTPSTLGAWAYDTLRPLL